ncbi:MAG: mandelate racemase/muconate lactonizing enzyme family protein [Megasphaera sp.]|uniref:mandelate racemase/muconate lactonizing enzyme family protein n=1 Tax=unclassified Megasphaera TaxID=2626256 RepID=UPI003A7FC015
MKITKIDLLLSDPVEGGWQPLFCRIYTDTGVYGDGEAALSYGGAVHAAFGMMRDLAPEIIGMNPLEHEVIWQKMYKDACFFGLNGGPITFAGMSAIDVALWDIKGKVYQAPLWEMLGGKQRTKLRAYASQLQNGWAGHRRPARTPEDYAHDAKVAVEKGFDAVKFNFTTFREDEGRYAGTEQTAFLHPKYMKVIESRIAAVRDVLGDTGDIILENHAYTDAQSAVQMGQMAKKYGILYFEEPVAPHADALRFVYDHTGIPVASGERIYSRWQFQECLDKEAIQVIQPDIGNSGGITEVKKICDMAYSREVGVQIHVCGSPLIVAASLNLEATLPHFVIHEYNVNTSMPKMLKLTKYTYEPENGQMDIPSLPGIGNEISDYAFQHSQIVSVTADDKQEIL